MSFDDIRRLGYQGGQNPGKEPAAEIYYGNKDGIRLV